MKQFSRTHIRLLAIASVTACWLFLHASGTAFAAKYRYDLTDDWSEGQNPNGVWSYNYNDSPISVYQTFWWGEPGWGNWWIGDGCILQGSQPTGTDPWGDSVGPSHDWESGDVMMHAL